MCFFILFYTSNINKLFIKFFNTTPYKFIQPIHKYTTNTKVHIKRFWKIINELYFSELIFSSKTQPLKGQKIS